MDKWKAFWLGWGKDMLLTLFGLGVITEQIATGQDKFPVLVLGGVFTGIAARLHWKALGFGEFGLSASRQQPPELPPPSSPPEGEGEAGEKP